MPLFNLPEIVAQLAGDQTTAVFHKSDVLKARVVKLDPGKAIPSCSMTDNALFYLLEGEAAITVNGETSLLKPGCCLIAAPGEIRMESTVGAALMGLQMPAPA